MSASAQGYGRAENTPADPGSVTRVSALRGARYGRRRRVLTRRLVLGSPRSYMVFGSRALVGLPNWFGFRSHPDDRVRQAVHHFGALSVPNVSNESRTRRSVSVAVIARVILVGGVDVRLVAVRTCDARAEVVAVLCPIALCGR